MWEISLFLLDLHARNNDDLKHSFLSQHDILSDHLEIENHVRGSQPHCVGNDFNLWNDTKFTSLTEELGELHSDFPVAKYLTFDLVQQTVTATQEKCKEKLVPLSFN